MHALPVYSKTTKASNNARRSKGHELEEEGSAVEELALKAVKACWKLEQRAFQITTLSFGHKSDEQ